MVSDQIAVKHKCNYEKQTNLKESKTKEWHAERHKISSTLKWFSAFSEIFIFNILVVNFRRNKINYDEFAVLVYGKDFFVSVELCRINFRVD